MIDCEILPALDIGAFSDQSMPFLAESRFPESDAAT
jgi:hypothetical protein